MPSKVCIDNLPLLVSSCGRLTGVTEGELVCDGGLTCGGFLGFTGEFFCLLTSTGVRGLPPSAALLLPSIL